MKNLSVRVLLSVFTIVNAAGAATLEQMSIEEMAQKSTLIVRGRVDRCAGEMRGSVIYTRCIVSVTERWKGQSPAQTEFLIPGGSARGYVQTFTGTPKFTAGDESVLFLWAGRSGVLQIIGLSQGKFDLKTASGGKASATRAASAERMIDKAGNEVSDHTLSVDVDALRAQVRRALAGGRQ